MARSTNTDLRKQLIYSVFVRDFSASGDFRGLENDLKRIKDLGTDTIWLMPVYPIGKVDRKGSLGSPYAIKDYLDIDINYGTKQSFHELVDKIHENNMKVMIDIVFNHTSRDSVLLSEHPEWFLRDEEGNLKNKNEEWTDVAQLDYGNLELWDYQIKVLKHYAEFVDGFRCDVAPQVPIDFWMKARSEVEKVNPKMMWLAESTDGEYVRSLRDRGFWSSSDGELYNAFDMTYDYEIDHLWRSYIKGEIDDSTYVAKLNEQTVIYPDNAIKMRGIENHDQSRAHNIIPNNNDLVNWTAFYGFQRGSMLIYNGQEIGAKHTPSLFEREPIEWDDIQIDLSDLIKKSHELMQDDIQVDGAYKIVSQGHGIVSVDYQLDDRKRIGVFTLRSNHGIAKVDVADGIYKNLLDGKEINISNGIIDVKGLPIIIDIG